MRKYSENVLKTVICNKCGKKIIVDNGIILEGVFSVDYSLGYFSEKDGEVHSFDLCEDCYDEMVKGYKIDIEIIDNNELI